MKTSATIMIERPIEDVFVFAANIENMGRWFTGVSEPRLTSDGDYGAGSTFASKYTYGGKTHDMAYEVVAYSPPTQHNFRSTSGPFPVQAYLKLRSDGINTEATHTIDAGSDSAITSLMFALLGPFLKIIMRKQLRQELTNLKMALESA